MTEELKKPTKESLLAAAIKEVRRRDRAADAVFFAMSGAIVRERQRMWSDGYDVSIYTMLKDVRERLNEAIAKEEGRTNIDAKSG